LVDFGLADKESIKKRIFTRCGTPGYVAPEVLNDKEYDCKVDCFNSGIILYILYL
jgi:serine/threonine protein kinase